MISAAALVCMQMVKICAYTEDQGRLGHISRLKQMNVHLKHESERSFAFEHAVAENHD